MPKFEPLLLSEVELDARYKTKGLLESGGDYGCGCALFDGDLDDDDGEMLFCDEWFHRYNDRHPNDVGTILVTGNVRSKQAISVSDRLMCLVILGSLEAPALSVFETETYVGGNLTVGELTDRNHYLTVKGKRTVAGKTDGQ